MKPGLKQSRSPVDDSHVEHRLEQLRDDEGGFTIVESIVALMLIMMVLIGSLAMMGASVKGIVTSRQRSVATSLAREVVERARAADYAAVGHDFNDDAALTVAADPNLAGAPLTFEGRRLVGSTVDKDPDSPFYPHRRTKVVGSITYTQWAYVTEQVPANGDPFKRVTVIVRWGNDQYNGAVADTVRVETQLFNASEPPDPLLLGEAEVDAGAIRVLSSPTPFLGDDRLTAATLFLPFTRSQVESRFVHTVRSLARSPRTELRTALDSGLNATSPCTKTNLANGSSAECPGVGTSVIADNDLGTAPTVDPAGQSLSVDGGTISRGNGSISLVLGATNLASSLATAASTISGNADGLPYTKSNASGPASYSMPFALGTASGSLATFSAPAVTEVAVDREGTGATSTISASSQVSHPAMKLLTFGATPVNPADSTSLAGYDGMVRTPASQVTMTTQAGRAAAASTFTAASFDISLFETDSAGNGAYRTVTITPGVASAASSTATFNVNGQPLTIEVTVTASPKVVESAADATATLIASQRLSSWLNVRVAVSGGSTGQVSYELDYGRVVASTSYEAPT